MVQQAAAIRIWKLTRVEKLTDLSLDWHLLKPVLCMVLYSDVTLMALSAGFRRSVTAPKISDDPTPYKFVRDAAINASNGELSGAEIGSGLVP